MMIKKNQKKERKGGKLFSPSPSEKCVIRMQDAIGQSVSQSEPSSRLHL